MNIIRTNCGWFCSWVMSREKNVSFLEPASWLKAATRKPLPGLRQAHTHTGVAFSGVGPANMYFGVPFNYPFKSSKSRHSQLGIPSIHQTIKIRCPQLGIPFKSSNNQNKALPTWSPFQIIKTRYTLKRREPHTVDGQNPLHTT